MNTEAEATLSDEERAQLEISLPTALELCRLGLGTLIDIRQTFEIEMKGAIPDTVHIPLFEAQRMRGHSRALSVAGGFQAWKKLQQAAQAAA